MINPLDTPTREQTEFGADQPPPDVMLPLTRDNDRPRQRWMPALLAAAAATVLVVGVAVATNRGGDDDVVEGGPTPSVTATTLPTQPTATVAPEPAPAGINVVDWLGEWVFEESVPAGNGTAQVLTHTLVLDTMSDGGLAVGRLTSVGQTTNDDVAVQAQDVDGTLAVSIVPGTESAAYADGAALFRLSGTPDAATTTLEGLATLQQGLEPTGSYFTRVRVIEWNDGEVTTGGGSLTEQAEAWIGSWTALDGGAGADEGNRPINDFELRFDGLTEDRENAAGVFRSVGYSIVDESERVEDLARTFELAVTGRPVDGGIEVIVQEVVSGNPGYTQGDVLFTLADDPTEPTTIPGDLVIVSAWELIDFTPGQLEPQPAVVATTAPPVPAEPGASQSGAGEGQVSTIAIADWLATYTAFEGAAGADEGRREMADYTLQLDRVGDRGAAIGTFTQYRRTIVNEQQTVDNPDHTFDVKVEAVPVGEQIEIKVLDDPASAQWFAPGAVLFRLSGDPASPTVTEGGLELLLGWDNFSLQRS